MSTVIASAFGREVNMLKGEADVLTETAYELVTSYKRTNTITCNYNSPYM